VSYTCQVDECQTIGAVRDLPGRSEKRCLCELHWLELLTLIHKNYPKEFKRREKAKAIKALKQARLIAETFLN
jgi:hypothetical protein